MNRVLLGDLGEFVIVVCSFALFIVGSAGAKEMFQKGAPFLCRVIGALAIAGSVVGWQWLPKPYGRVVTAATAHVDGEDVVTVTFNEPIKRKHGISHVSVDRSFRVDDGAAHLIQPDEGRVDGLVGALAHHRGVDHRHERHRADRGVRLLAGERASPR